MKQIIRFFLLLTALIMGAVGEMKAIERKNIIFSFDNTKGSADLVSGDGAFTSVDDGTKVTIIVTPENGYSISAGSIIVEKMVDPQNAARRRTSGLSESLPVTNEGSNNYSFVIPTGYEGAYVTVNFYPTPTGGFTAITSLEEITNLETGRYELASDINASIQQMVHH